MYLCSAGYDPEREHTILATDPALDIQWPGVDHVLSDRDTEAPTLDEVKAAGLLPSSVARAAARCASSAWPRWTPSKLPSASTAPRKASGRDLSRSRTTAVGSGRAGASAWDGINRKRPPAPANGAMTVFAAKAGGASRPRAGGKRHPRGFGGIATQASPSITALPSTRHSQKKRALRRSATSSTTSTRAVTTSPILTGARKVKVWER